MQNHPGRGRLINVGCRWNAGKNRAPAPPGRAYALRAPRSDFREIRGFLRIILPPLHAAPWKKSDSASGKSAATFRLRYANRATRPITLGFGASELENPAGEAEKKGEKGKKEESGKGNKKGGLPGLWPLAGPRTRSTGSVRGGREGKLNVRKKVANVVKIRDRQSGALCPAGEQYRRRSGDWRIFLRIGRHCWIFQIVFLAYAAAEIARNPFGHCHLSILLLSILRFIAIYQIYRS